MLPPLIRSRSLRLSGTACTRTRTSPASGAGTGTVSRRSTAVGRGPYSWVRHARIDSVMRRYVTDRGPALRRGPDTWTFVVRLCRELLRRRLGRVELCALQRCLCTRVLVQRDADCRRCRVTDADTLRVLRDE